MKRPLIRSQLGAGHLAFRARRDAEQVRKDRRRNAPLLKALRHLWLRDLELAAARYRPEGSTDVRGDAQ